MPKRAALLLIAIVASAWLVSPGRVGAKGPNQVAFDLEMSGGGTIPSAGNPVSFVYHVPIDFQGGDPVYGNQSPSDVGFPDAIYIFDDGVTLMPGPGMPGSEMSAGAVGARIGNIESRTHENWIDLLAPHQSVVYQGAFAGAVPNCGDNNPQHITRDYTGHPLTNEEAASTFLEKIMAGDMSGRGVLANSLYGAGFTPSQYVANGGPLVQSFDDDNDNGILDGLEGGVSEPSTPNNANAYPHPYATGNNGGVYLAGTSETQHDSDADGVPDGAEAMPDFLPLWVEGLGLGPYWVQRGYAGLVPFVNRIPVFDVHVLGFSGVPGIGSFRTMKIGSPWAPGNRTLEPMLFCTPMDPIITFDGQTSVEELCAGRECDEPAGVTDFGDAVQVVSSNGSHTASVWISDAEDYDNDNKVEPLDLCNRDASTNADPDNDLVAGICDANPSSWDNDGDGDASTDDRALSLNELLGINGAQLASCQTTGNGICDNDADDDGWINNIDNCETTPNPEQFDREGDGVGDACDSFFITDPLSGLPAGPGNGGNTSEGIDNDLLCAETWTTGGVEPSGDGVAPGGCANINDANDNGVVDANDMSSDSDGDGTTDAAETAAGTNPLDPYSFPLPCLVAITAPDDINDNFYRDTCEALGASDPIDDDGDGVLDGLEYGARTSLVGSSAAYQPPDGDRDGDGCSNSRELNAMPQRHPGNWWDNYDVNANGNVDLSDTIAILQKFGQPDQQKDRRRLLSPGPPALLVEANDGVDLTEALANLFQFGWGGCVAPGLTPAQGGGIYD